MLLDSNGHPFSTEELSPPRRKPPCEACGSIKPRIVTKGFGGWWRLTCPCGQEVARGQGEFPEGEV